MGVRSASEAEGKNPEADVVPLAMHNKKIPHRHVEI